MTCCQGSGVDPDVACGDQLRVVGRHGGERLGGRDPVHQGREPSDDVCRGVGRSANGMPAASMAAVYGEPPPGSQPLTNGSSAPCQPGGSGRPGTGRADDMDALSRSDGAGDPGRARPDPISAAVRITSRRHSGWHAASSIAPAAAAAPRGRSARLLADRSPPQTMSLHDRASGIRDGHEDQADRLAGVTSGRPGDARDGDRKVAPETAPDTLGHRLRPPPRTRRHVSRCSTAGTSTNRSLRASL